MTMTTATSAAAITLRYVVDAKRDVIETKNCTFRMRHLWKLFAESQMKHVWFLSFEFSIPLREYVSLSASLCHLIFASTHWRDTILLVVKQRCAQAHLFVLLLRLLLNSMQCAHVMPLNGKCAIFLIDSGSVETKRLVTRDNCDAQRNHFRGIDFE